MKGAGSFGSAFELEAWLRQSVGWMAGRRQPTDTWVGDLYTELNNGLSTLEVVEGLDSNGDPMISVQRHVRSVKVVIKHKKVPEAYLEEGMQKRLPDYIDTDLNMLLTEPLGASEAPSAAARRGIRKAFGELIATAEKSPMRKPSDDLVVEEAFTKCREETDAPTFPGLQSYYYRVEATMSDLPMMAAFSTEEALTEDGSQRLQRIWEWRPKLIPSEHLHLSPEKEKVLQRLYKGSSQVRLSILHGGYSGSMVLMASSDDMEGKPEEPTIVKLDKAADLKEEVNRTRAILTHIEKSASQIVKPPEYINDFGGVVLEMAGACWVLPQFASKASIQDDKLLYTLREVFIDQFRMSCTGNLSAVTGLRSPARRAAVCYARVMSPRRRISRVM